MTGRLIYLVAGAVLGGYVVHRLNRTARAWSPEGIADRVEDRVADYRAALREFNEDVHAAMEQREAELLRLYSAERAAPGGALPRTARAQIHTHGANGAPEMKDGR
ncbi:hypothetical protein [Nocardiopsis chromatogenes]|uniref:hypothetical protein n=1 Tax=Nocardiopsis chromatogenes TaxID=280239 RepID=UPI000344B724|nr:hypothetical protein [Nocardiopsis chromatogenes]